MSRYAVRLLDLAIAMLVLLTGSAASGAELDVALTQYGHTAWRIQDGAFSGIPNALAQTADGYLWIGTQAGLLRFDGMRFVAYPDIALPVKALLAAKDGVLLVGTASGLYSVLDGRSHRIEGATGHINAIIQTSAGEIWFTRSRLEKDGQPLCRLEYGAVTCFGRESGIQASHAGGLASDASGNLWLKEGDVVRRWSPGATQAFRPEALRSIDATLVFTALLPLEDGSVLVGISLKGPGLGLLSLEGEEWHQAKVPGIDSTQLSIASLMVEQDRSMWIGTTGEGVIRVHHQRSHRFSEADGLTGNDVTSMLQDLEGNVWVTTMKGLDCFRRLPVVSYSQRQGLPSDSMASVTAARDGSIWVGGKHGFAHLQGDSLTATRREEGLPGVHVSTLLERVPGRLWVGIDDDLFSYSNAVFKKVVRDSSSANSPMVAVVGDTDNNVWVLSTGRPYHLFRLDAPTGRLLEIPAPASHSMGSIAADPGGGLLVGSKTAVLGLRGGLWRTIARTGMQVSQIATAPDGSFWGATPHGLFGWKDHHGELLDIQSGLPCEDIYSAILDKDENLWAYASCGLIEVPRASLSKWWENRGNKVTARVFDVFDGVLASSTPFSPAAVRSADGRLWFANGNILQTIDPSTLSPSRSRLQVRIEEFVADHAPVAFSHPPSLPALTRSVELRYTGLSPANAQRLKFRYRLDGVDASWQDAGTRRAAFYNDLRPGRYRFHVIALDSGGTWTEDGATVEFVVLPAWYQTMLFRIAALLAVFISTWAVYSARIGQVRREAAARYDERMEERTRLARDLHDTLLQTIQASKMIADVALEETGTPSVQRHAVERISTWLGQAVEEGRAALQSLRLEGDVSNDLAVALANEAARTDGTASLRTVFIAEGNAWEMHPILQDEVFRIGAEAIKNARAHSNARQLSVTLVYGTDLVVRVADDGDGIDPTFLVRGRPGHFGIAGMRERATRIGADLSIEAIASGGSAVTLTLPRAGSHPRGAAWRRRIRAWARHP